MKKLLIIILLIPLLSSCSGTGSKSIPNTSISNRSSSTLFFARKGGYVGGGVLASIKVNGREIAKLGTKEFTQHKVSGSFNINVSASGMNSLVFGKDSISGSGSNGSKHFYIINVETGLLQGSFKITETTESGFQQSMWSKKFNTYII